MQCFNAECSATLLLLICTRYMFMRLKQKKVISYNCEDIGNLNITSDHTDYRVARMLLMCIRYTIVAEIEKGRKNISLGI